MIKLGNLHEPGVLAALGSALLFGLGTPLAKQLLADLNPWLLAGLLYLGSGLGMSLYRRISGAQPVQLPAAERGWLAGAVLCGGVVAPVLLMLGLRGLPASDASLLLNAEAVFTALLAWFAFRENVDRRVAFGMLAIVAGAVLLSWPARPDLSALGPALLVLAACLCWALDNNLTRKLSLSDASWIAAFKGVASGGVNVTLALSLGAQLPTPTQLLQALLLGFVAYGLSLSLFVLALRRLGTARTGAYFSVAPFFGALLALALGESASLRLGAAGLLMAYGVWLHLSERHEHAHHHEPMQHDHEHVHDAHHQHEHEAPVAPGTRHRHPHRHEALTHRHAHFPDAHHRHRH